MPKPQTLPILYDNLKTVSISFLRKHGYLRPNQLQGGIITWSKNGKNTGSISIKVNNLTDTPYLELNYERNEAPINYRVQLISAPSNLGKGVVWYFVCPQTGKLCRKLYLVGNYFYHRSAFRGCMYEKQTYSKLGKAYDAYFGVDNLYQQLYKKHFKRKYAGKPTKRYLKITQQINRAENALTWN